MSEEPQPPKIFQPEPKDYPSLNPPQVPDHSLVRCIGSGSYGDVWLAHSASGTWRAVKVVHRQTFQKDKPFEREFTGILKFEPVSRTHEGMVDILLVGRDEESGCFYYVMELADDILLGREVAPDRYIPKTIGQVLEQRKRLPFGECLRLAMGLASALGHLHDHGLIHRDVKPSNIIYVEGQPKLADIGLVAEVSDARSFVGTEGYIPPEGPGTPAADLFGLGKVIYEMATGRDRKNYPELPDDFHNQPDHAGLVELNEIIVKACANKVEDRYQNVAEMMADLALLQSGRSVKQARTMALRLAVARRWGMVATVAAGLFGAAFFFAEHQTQRARRAENVARFAKQQATDRLYDSLLAQARLGRRSGETGRRLKTMAAIAEAAAINPSMALRNEALATIVLHDLQETSWFKDGPVTHPNSVAFTSTFSHYAMRDYENHVQVRARDTDETVASLDMPAPAGIKVLFSPDDNHLVINNRSTREIIYWNWRQKKVLWTYRPPASAVSYYDINISPKGDVLVASLYEKGGKSTLIISDVASGMELDPMHWNGSVIQGAQFNHSGDRLAVAVGRKVEVLAWPSRKSITSYRSLDTYSSLAWHPQGKRLAAGNDKGTIYLYTFNQATPLVLQGHDKYVWKLFFSHHGDLLVSISWDGSTRFWDAANGKFLFTSQEGLGIQMRDDDSELAFSRSTVGAGIWKMARPSGLRRLTVERSQSSEIRGLDFSEDNRWLISGHGGSWKLWNLNSFGPSQRFRAGGRVRSVHFLANQSGVIASGAHGAQQWSMILTNSPDSIIVDKSNIRTLTTRSYRSDLSSDGRYLVVAGAGFGEIVDLNNPDARVQLSDPGWEYYQVVFVNGHQWIVTSDRSGLKTRVWDALTGELLHELGAFYGHLAGSSDGKTLVTGSATEVAFWDTGNWVKRFEFPLKLASRASVAVAVSPDNRMAAAAVDRQSIALFNLEDGSLMARLAATGKNYIHDLRFSPNNRQVAAATGDYEIQLWDLEELSKELISMNLDW